MTVTFVTAFINLNEPRPKSRSNESRIQLFNQLIATGIRLHVFTSPEFRELLPLEIHGVIETISFEDMQLYSISPQGIPDIRAEEHDTRNFLILMNAKIEFMKRAIESGHSSHFAWVDFNLYHVLQDPDSANELRAIETASLPSRCMYFPGCWGPTVMFDQVNWRFCGGFFLGDRQSLLDLYDLYLREYPHLPKLTWEVNVWAYLETKGWKPTWYLADHTPSIIRIPRNVLCIPQDIQHTWASYDQKLSIHGPIYNYVLQCIRSHPLTAVFPQTDGIIGDEEYDRMVSSLGRIPHEVTPAKHYHNFESVHPGTLPLVCIYAAREFSAKSLFLLPWDDIAFVHGLTFPQIPWSEKSSCVLWRGGSSGFHRPSTRMRVVEKLFGVPNTDVKFVPGGWPFNDDVIPSEHFANKTLLGPHMHSHYKYVLIIDGNTQASNGQWGFALGSVPILITHPGSRWWFYDELRPMINYVPVQYDLSDLVEKIEWLLSHDEEAQQIALNALELSNRVFSPTFQQDYINNGIQQILQQDR
jgi:hypothetical protein